MSGAAVPHASSARGAVDRITRGPSANRLRPFHYLYPSNAFVRHARIPVFATALPDAESDGYSLQEALRPGVHQARMLQAIREGCLEQMLQGRPVDLPMSVALCLEVLGLGTSTCGDAAWQQSKSGNPAEVLHEEFARCIGILSTVAEVLPPPPFTDSQGDNRRPSDAILKSKEAAALTAAAAAVLRPPLIALLSSDQLISGVEALAACLARGCDDPSVLAALAEMLRAVPNGAERVAAAAAVVEAGAIPALAQTVKSGIWRQKKKLQLTRPGKDGFFCLTEVLVSGNMASGSGIRSALKHTWKGAAIPTLLPLLQLPVPEDASRVLQALSVLAGHREDEGQNEVVVALKAVPDAERTALLTSALDAAKRLLTDGSAHLAGDIACACALLRLFAAIVQANLITVQQLQSHTPGLIGAAIGVMLGACPSPEWSGLFEPLWSAPTSSPSSETGSASTCIKCYPVPVQSAAIQLAYPLLAYALRTDRSEWEEWLDSKGLATQLIKCLVSETTDFNRFGIAGVQACMLSLQLTSPQDLWREEAMSGMLPELVKVLEDPSHIADPSQVDARLAALQLSAVALVSGWQGSISTDSGSFPQDSRPTAEALLHLAATFLNQATAPWSEISRAQQLALVAGAVNAVIACLAPNAARRACSNDHHLLLPELSPRLLQARDVSTEPLLTLSPALDLSACMIDSRKPPSLSVQLQWMFERPPLSNDSVRPVLQWFGQGCYRSNIRSPHPTEYISVASTTAPPLLQALFAAARRLTELVREVVGAAAAGSIRGMGVSGGQRVTDLVFMALAVSKEVMNVLARCVPPGSKKCD